MTLACPPHAIRADADWARALRVAGIVGPHWLIPAETLFRTTRGGAIEARARHEFQYLLHTACGLSIERVGKVTGRDRSSVSYAVGAVEDSLDDPDRAHRMERLSALAREACELGEALDRAFAALMPQPKAPAP